MYLNCHYNTTCTSQLSQRNNPSVLGGLFTYQQFPPEQFSPQQAPLPQSSPLFWSALVSIWILNIIAHFNMNHMQAASGSSWIWRGKFTHSLFLSTTLLTLMALCSEYSLHTPSKQWQRKTWHDCTVLCTKILKYWEYLLGFSLNSN